MVNYVLYKIGQSIALSFPRKVAYGIAVFCSDLHYFFADVDKKTTKANLKVIFPQMDDRQICQIRLRMFRNFAKHMVDFLRLHEMNKEFIDKNIKIENLHYLDEALKKGKGAITLTAHFGSWELGGALIGTLGYPFWVVALSHKDGKVNRFFDQQRESKGVRVLTLGKAVRGCINTLKNNQILGLVGDRDFNENGMTMNFFGKPTIFPEGAAQFCLKLGTPILPGFMLRNSDDSFTFKFEKPLEATPTGDKEKDIKALISVYKDIFERYIREHPDQWFMFKRFWVE